MLDKVQRNKQQRLALHLNCTLMRKSRHECKRRVFLGGTHVLFISVLQEGMTYYDSKAVNQRKS